MGAAVVVTVLSQLRPVDAVVADAAVAATAVAATQGREEKAHPWRR